MKTRGLTLGLAASIRAILAGNSVAAAPWHAGPTIRPKGWRSSGRSSKYMPHQGDGEILRRVRQRQKLLLHYYGNGGFSRRGNEIGLI